MAGSREGRSEAGWRSAGVCAGAASSRPRDLLDVLGDSAAGVGGFEEGSGARAGMSKETDFFGFEGADPSDARAGLGSS